MKKTIVLLLIATILIVSVSAKGSIGLGIGHQLLISQKKGLISQGINTEIYGENNFGMVGVGYSVYKPFYFGRLIDWETIGRSVNFLLNFDLTDNLKASLELGLFNCITGGSTLISQLGPVTGISLSYMPLAALKLSLHAEYRTPLLQIYERSAKLTVLTEHYLMYGLRVSYAY